MCCWDSALPSRPRILSRPLKVTVICWSRLGQKKMHQLIPQFSGDFIDWFCFVLLSCASLTHSTPYYLLWCWFRSLFEELLNSKIMHTKFNLIGVKKNLRLQDFLTSLALISLVLRETVQIEVIFDWNMLWLVGYVVVVPKHKMEENLFEKLAHGMGMIVFSYAKTDCVKLSKKNLYFGVVYELNSRGMKLVCHRSTFLFFFLWVYLVGFSW